MKTLFLLKSKTFSGLRTDKRTENIQLFTRLILLGIFTFLAIFVVSEAMAQVSLPGSDESGQLEAAGTLLRIVDTALFKWAARILAGVCILASGWALKEQRFGVAVVCIVGAIVFGTAPTWVRNIFDIGGSAGLFN